MNINNNNVNNKIYFALILLVIIVVSLTIKAEGFFTTSNFLMLLEHGVILGILSLAVGFIVIIGDLDIAFANVCGVAGVFSAFLHLKFGLNIFWTLLFTLLLGVLFYAFSGFLISHKGYAPLVISIGLSNIAMGLNYSLSNGRPIHGNMASSFIWIAKGEIFFIPFSVILLICFYGITYWIWNYTVLGYNMYAIGDNQVAAEVSGINVKKFKFISYLLCGFFTAVAGIINTAKFESGQPSLGPNYMLEALAVVFFAKAISRREAPTIQGTLLGLLLLSIISNGITIIGFPSYIYQFFIGGFLVIALIAEHFNKILSLFKKTKNNNEIKVNI